MKPILLCCFSIFLFIPARAQKNEYTEKKHQYLSYGKIPTWSGVASEWDKDVPQIHLYNSQEYKGHAEFVSRGLKTGITFKQFRDLVKNPAGRRYMPFFLYDLRKMPAELAGKKHTWALRLEDYGYTDTPKEMGEEVLRLLENISVLTSDKNGILILSTSTTARPNSSIKDFIEKHAYSCLTLSQLIAKAGGSRTKVLNAGTVFGYLRYAGANDPPRHFGPSDIVVYEQLPRRVPPVAGFITLEPQTPLSHVNLLAINRGSVNIYISDAATLPGLKSLIGKPVKLSAKGNQEVKLVAASEQEVKQFADSRIRQVDIPVPVKTYAEIVVLGKDSGAGMSTAFIGAKAANYHRMYRKVPEHVKPGSAIPFYYYFKVFESSGADSILRKLLQVKDTADTKLVYSLLAEMRERILHASIDPALLKQMRIFISEQFGEKKIRLRSSTNCEDLPDFNGAGLYLSKGFQADESDRKLEMKLLEIYTSLWTPLAFEEREFYRIDHRKAGMAILINQAYSKELANGVVLTLP
ncbi:MAG: PEP/pyruvate-binding domain-containing protein, partial [Cytophagaceae bacterium]